MARDNPPHIRQKEQLKRKKASRQSRDRILIVCEGTKTEPRYFKEVKKLERVSAANITIIPSNRPQPQKILDFVVERLKKDKQWEYVYLVFDQDNHREFEEVRMNIGNLKHRNDLKEPIQFTAIWSAPCFEIWFLLHFQYTTQDFQACHDMVKILMKHIPNYSKGQEGYFSQTREKLPTALENTKKLAAEHQKANTASFTNVDVLVEQLLRPSSEKGGLI